MEALATIGHNQPPDEIEMARITYRDVSSFMADHPVIETEDQARAAKFIIDRGTAALKDVEIARERESKPLHTAWKACLDKFKPASESLTKLVDELKRRQTHFARAEESRRMAEAEQKRLAAEEALRAAHEAEKAEWEAKDNAAAGELGLDVGEAIAATDAAISEAKTAHRKAALAERESRVRIGGGFGKVQALRSVEILHLADPMKALETMGITDKIREAILSAARDYRKEHKRLPDGVLSFIERKI